MSEREPTVLLEGLCFAEGPRWHRDRLYFSDMHGCEVVAVDLEGRRETIAQVPGHPSGLGFTPDGRMLVVSMRDRKLLHGNGAALEVFADLSAFASGNCNDMVVDGLGRACVGNFGFDFENDGKPQTTTLALVDVDGSVRVVASELSFPNGLVISEDGKTLIVAETFGACLTAFDIAKDGSLSGRRVWAQLQAFPDGICLDAEGCVWIANPVPGGAFMRIEESGRVVDSIPSSDKFLPIACMFGGPERRTLFLLEARHIRPHLSTPGNSRIRKLDVEVGGSGKP